MVAATALMFFSIGFGGRAQYTSVDIVEFNTAMLHGHPIEQVLFWRWNKEYGRYDVLGWCNADECEMVSTHVVRHKPSGYLVRTGEIRRTKTPHDPETAQRKLLPVDCRLGMPWESARRRAPIHGAGL